MADNQTMVVKTTAGAGETLITPASDDVGGNLYQRVKISHGADGSATDSSSASPLPVREPVKGSALGKGGTATLTASTAATIVATNSSRTVVEVSNGHATVGVWLAFGSTAVVGQGTFLPPFATGYWPTTAAVSAIASAAAGPVGYTEW